MTEHVVVRVNDGWYVCERCGQTGSERWAILHQWPVSVSMGGWKL